MPQWKFRSLQETTSQGFTVRLDGCSGHEVVLHGGTVVPITHHLGVYQLVWKLIGCPRQQCHYRVCASKTLQHPSDLWCPFCNYNEQQWRQAGKRVLPCAELAFIDMLRAVHIDTTFSCQTTAAFWPAPLDFCNMRQGYFVQIDGRCHWAGMHKLSSSEVIARDMRQNLAAIQADACVVRVHECDLSNVECVAAAMHAAGLGCCIVLTPAYAAAMVKHGPSLLSYVQLLLLLSPNCCVDLDLYGNSRVWKM